MVTSLLSVALVACNKDKNKGPAYQTGDEAGTYYFDADGQEYTVTLNAGAQFTLDVAGVTKSGSYKLEGDVLTLSPQNENQFSAVFKDDVIVLTLGEAEYRLLKKVNYTVTFNTNEGSAVNSASVLNGKKVAKPADPTKEGYIFVGWYEDDQFGNSFAFNSRIVTADVTVYARWTEKQVGKREWAVQFDAAGGTVPSSMTTLGGKLFNLPSSEREGYAFKGWWLSMSGDGRLSYEFKDGMSLDANTTLHALWQANDLGGKLADPLVSVESDKVSWGAVSGAREYLLQVKDSDGNCIVNTSVSATVEAVSFDSYPAGDYVVTVEAVASSGEANNSVAMRLYKNKAIARVSQFSVVEPAMLIFNAVDNAEKYLISVDCGDKNHSHVNFDNGLSTNFDFSDCMMQNGGIKFTVTASAQGFASSVSQQFVYAQTLAAVSEFKLDEQTQKLVWNQIDNATGYMVSVKCGNDAHSEEFVNIGAVNSVSLKECAKCDGGIVVKVYPVSKFYISPSEATYTFNKQNLATPSDIRIQGTTVSWAEVAGAASYEVRIAGATLTSDTNSIDLAGQVALTEKANYAITVVAKGDQDSLASDPIDARNLAMADALKYGGSVLSWQHVIGAAFYDVQVNDESVFSVSNGVNFTKVTLTKAGENVLKVRFVDESGTAFEWMETKVFAHTLTFDSNGGSSVDEQYKAIGDEIDLPSPSKEGYDFLNWYNTPKGPESNGAAYVGSTFGGVSGDLVLYACYTPKAYTLTYHYGDGGNGSEESCTVYYTKDYQLTVPEANLPTSAFGGWYSAPNGAGLQYTDDKGASLNPWNKLGDADVYAFWYDDVLSFASASIAGNPVVSVYKGSRVDQLSAITIPSEYKGVKVGMLPAGAFKDCSNLVTVNLPNTLEDIGSEAFAGCTSLTAVNIYEVDGNGSVRYWSADGVLFDKGRLDEQPTDPAQVRSVISFMPLGKTGSYIIPNGIVEIPMLSFANCALTRIVIPSSVTTIGLEAFKGAEKLTTVVFDTGSTAGLTISNGAFSGCKALETITLPSRLVSIGLKRYELFTATGVPASQTVSLETNVTNAFVGCKNLTNIYIAKGNKNYKSENGIIYTADGGTLLYALSSVKGEVEIPVGVKVIADGAFISCNSITKVTIPNTVETVGECAFYKTNIEEVVFNGDGMSDVKIGKYAFRDCDDLEAVTFEEDIEHGIASKVAEIGEGAFFGCTYLTSITLTSKVKSVGEQAFRGCSRLAEIAVASTASELTFGSDAFYECVKLTTVKLPANVSKLPSVFGGCTSLTEVIVDANNPYFTSENGALYNKAKTEIVFYPASRTDSNLVLPETLETISSGVFAGSKIECVVIGKNVKTIGEYAFKDSYLKQISFADGGNADLAIGAYAFTNSRLVNVVLPARTKSVGEYAFAMEWDNNLRERKLGSLRSITFNEGLSEISDNILQGQTKVAEIKIPSSVERIGKYAFNLCGMDEWKLNVEFASGSQVTLIDDFAFYGVDPDGWSSASTVVLTMDLPNGLQHIGYSAFRYMLVKEIEIPNTVKTIGAYAFANNTRLTSLTFENDGSADLILGTVESNYTDYKGNKLEGNVFNGCTNLQSVELPERLKFLGAGAFYSCTLLTGISFGQNSRLQYIGSEAFSGTTPKTLTVPKSVANGDIVVDANGTTEPRIGVADKAFCGLRYTDDVTFEGGGTLPLSFGEQAFYSYADTRDGAYDGIKVVNLPSRIADWQENGNTVRGISERTFADMSSSLTSGEPMVSSGQTSSSKLEAINIAAGGQHYCSVDGVVYTADMKTLVLCPVNKTGKVTVDPRVELIAVNSFRNGKLSEVEFAGGSADMVIGENAFRGCNSLTEVVLSDNVVEIGAQAFGYCTNLTKFTLSANIIDFDPNIFKGTNITDLSVSNNSGDYAAVNGVMFSKDMKTLLMYPKTLAASAYTVPAGVTAIAAYAFADNTDIAEVVLPAGLTTIDERAFSGCKNLKTINIPNTVESIGAYAFYSCASNYTAPAGLEISFEKDGTEGLAIGRYAFNDAKLTALDFPARLSSIGECAFYSCIRLKSVTFENEGSQLTFIDDWAFRGDYQLTRIDLPQGLAKLGDYVFYGCSGLTAATFGEGLIEIGDYTFGKCEGLVSVSFPASLRKMGAGTFAEDPSSYSSYPCAELTTVTFAKGSQLEVIPHSTFYKTKLESFEIPASVKVIEGRPKDGSSYKSRTYGAFEYCQSLKSVTFENGSRIKEIGDYAFDHCSVMEKFDIPNSVARLGAYAFSYCYALTKIVIPNAATVYGNNLFQYCQALEDVTLSSKATALPSSMFSNCKKLKQVDIPASVTSYGDYLFYGAGLESFTAPANMTAIPRSFFSGCKSLVSVTLPVGVKTIGESAFYECAELAEITLPNSVTSIDSKAFYNCQKLASVTLSENLEAIGAQAFYKCVFESITMHDKVVKVVSQAFEKCSNLKEVQLSGALKEFYGNSFNDCSSIESFSIGSGNVGDNFKVIDGIVYSKDGKKLVCAPAAKTGTVTVPSIVTEISYRAFSSCQITGIVLPNGLELVDSYAFYDCDKLTSVTMPSAKTIGYYAFAGCAFSGITLPTNLTEMGQYAFYSCTELTAIEIPAGVTVLPDYVFKSCAKLGTVTIKGNVTYIGRYAFSYCKKLSSITLPSSVEEIGTYAFEYCETLTSIAIPNKVTVLPSYLLQYCKLLETVKLPSSLVQIGSNAFRNCNAITAFSMDNNSNENFKVVNGVLFDSSGSRIILFPSGKTGEFTVGKDVAAMENIFSSGNLDVLKFEDRVVAGQEGTDNDVRFNITSQYESWVYYGKAKTFVLSAKAFKYINYKCFYNYSAAQTIAFVETEEEIKAMGSDGWYINIGELRKLNSNVQLVFGYGRPATPDPDPETPDPENPDPTDPEEPENPTDPENPSPEAPANPEQTVDIGKEEE